MKQDSPSMKERICRIPAVTVEYLKRPQVWGFFLSLAVIALLSILFFHPDAAEGNELRQYDMQQGAAIGQEVKAYMAEHPDAQEPRWTNSIFGGMPTFQISPTYPSDHLFSWITTLYGGGLPSPSNLLFMMMTGMLIMLLCMKVRWYYALIGAVAWGFSSYFVIIIGAGHIWKFVTLAYIPPTIGGIVMAYRGRWLAGSALAALFAMMQIQSNHVQMTYYFLFVVLAIILCYAVDAMRRKKYRSFCRATGALLIAGALAVCANLPSLYNTYEYSKETMRGQHSELTSKESKADDATSGLDRSYITQYSYGQAESFSLLIPNVKGGASARPEAGRMVPTSVIEVPGAEEKAMQQLDQYEQQYVANYVGQYFGEPEGTNGPVYVGAVIFALFLLGCVIVRGPMKWALLVMTLLSVFLALGRNMQWLTDLFIDYVPMYSKFRTVESILVIAEFTMPVLAILALQKILKAPARRERYLPALYWTFGIVGAVCLVGWLVPSVFGNPITENDEYISQMIGQQLAYSGYPAELVDKLSIHNPAIAAYVSEIRYGMVSADSLRSLIFVLLTFGVLWFSCRNKNFKAWQGAVMIGILVAADLYTVDKRYLSHDSFCPPEISHSDPFPMSATDRQILADTAMNYRVMDIPRFDRPEPSYYHKTVGGYHAAKLTRYQDLIDRHLRSFTQGNPTEQDFRILNMLNAKYIISPDGQVMTNPNALGNAWFVDRIVWADTPDAEMAALDTINPATTAVADQRFRDLLASAATSGSAATTPADGSPEPGIADGKAGIADGSSQAGIADGEAVPAPAQPGDTIFETSYAPGRLSYSAETSRPRVAVFSEIYFPWGWNVTIDGKPAQLARVNYLLRALTIPAGKHTIEMAFEPKSVSTSVGIARWAVIIIYLGLFAALLGVLLKESGNRS